MEILQIIGQPIFELFRAIGANRNEAVMGTWIVLAVILLLLAFVVWRLFLRKRKPAVAALADADIGASVSGLTPQAMEELERAQALLKQEAISPLEYERMKAKILKI